MLHRAQNEYGKCGGEADRVIEVRSFILLLFFFCCSFFFLHSDLFVRCALPNRSYSSFSPAERHTIATHWRNVWPNSICLSFKSWQSYSATRSIWHVRSTHPYIYTRHDTTRTSDERLFIIIFKNNIKHDIFRGFFLFVDFSSFFSAWTLSCAFRIPFNRLIWNEYKWMASTQSLWSLWLTLLRAFSHATHTHTRASTPNAHVSIVSCLSRIHVESAMYLN